MTIRPNQNEAFFSASEALLQAGYEDCGFMYGPRNPVNGEEKRYSIFKNLSTGKFYSLAGMQNFNTQISSISLKPVDADRLTDYSWKG